MKQWFTHILLNFSSCMLCVMYSAIIFQGCCTGNGAANIVIAPAAVHKTLTSMHKIVWHYSDVVMSVSNHRRLECLLDRSGVDQGKHQSSASLAFVRGIRRWPVFSLHTPVTRKMFPFVYVIMRYLTTEQQNTAEPDPQIETYFINRIERTLFYFEWRKTLPVVRTCSVPCRFVVGIFQINGKQWQTVQL